MHGFGKRRLRFAVDAKNLLADGVRPAGKEAGLGGSRPAFDARIPETSTRLLRKYAMSASPAGSSPTALIGKTRVPKAAKLLAALAPPPGTKCVSR